MFRSIRSRVFIFAVVLAFVGSIAVSQDIAPGTSIADNSSVFVLRSSSKRQMRSAVTPTFLPSTKMKRRIQPKKGSGKAVVKKQAPRRASRAVRAETMAANAEQLLDAGKIDESIAAFREAAGTDPKNQRARFGLSDALSAKGIAVSAAGDDAAALVFLNESIMLNDTNDFAYAELGEIALREHEYDTAIKNYESALGINPDIFALNVPLGFAYLEKNELVKAEACLAKADAAGIADGEVSNLRGMIFFRQNRPEEALAAFEETLRYQGRDPLANYYRGVLYDQTGRAELSTDSYRAAIEAQPEMSEAWFGLGVRHYNAGEYEKAAEAYKRAVAIEPDNAQAHANLASSYRQLERYSEANAEYKLAEIGIKNDADLYSEWGFCLGKTDEWEKAIQRLETAQRLSPQAIDYTNTGWGYYNAAIRDREQNGPEAGEAKLRSALLILQKAVDADSRFAAAYVNLGSTNNALGNHESAADALNTALSLQNDWVVALNQLGIANRGLGKFKDAIRNFERATTVEPNNTFGLYNLGEAYFLAGEKRNARRIRDRLKPLDAGLANRLDRIISGEIILDEAKRELRRRLPKIPSWPY